MIKRTPLKKPKKKMLDCGHFGFNFSRNRCRSCANKQDSKPLVRTAIKKSNAPIRKVKVSDGDYKALVLKLDRLFSQYIRLKDADKDGNVRCFVTEQLMPWTKIQCGHYIPRSHMATRWMEANCFPQSPSSNRYHEENTEPFRQALIRYEGESLVSYLEDMAKRIVKHSEADLKEMIAFYSEKVKQLKDGN